MTCKGTIVMPIAGKSSRFPGTRPKWMLSTPDGRLLLEVALDSIPAWREYRLVLGALSAHLHQQGGLAAIRRSLGQYAEIVEFENVTRGPAETVEQIIRRAEIEGPIFIKDCDSWFQCETDVMDNIICVADLKRSPHIQNVANKSFVQMNESNIVETILEKVVSSNFISVGGYGFASAEHFLNCYEQLDKRGTLHELFVSHVILESIKRRTVFNAVIVDDYEDVGTLEAWHNYRDRFSIYIIDLDGVVLKNAGAYIEPLWSDPDVPIIENVEALRELAKNGAQFVFMTARTEEYKEKTQATLKSLGLSWHTIIYGVHHARRFLINDFAASNPYPSAVAINLPRNSSELESMLKIPKN